MDCSIGKGGKAKGVRLGIENNDGEVNNTEKNPPKNKKQNRCRNNNKFSLFGKSSGVIP
jgi:hypothetical protein